MEMAVGAEPFRCGHVAIVGRPSVGKSTLMNALIGQKVSITSKKPQTTRHRIVGIDTHERAQVIYVDTPGFQTRHRSLLNDRLNSAVREALGDVDVVVFVIDATRITEADRAVARLLPDAVPVVCAVNKIDLVRDKALLLPLLAGVSEMFAFAAVVGVGVQGAAAHHHRALGIVVDADRQRIGQVGLGRGTGGAAGQGDHDQGQGSVGEFHDVGKI